MISMDKKYKTRDGRNVRLLCTDGPSKKWPVIGIIEGDEATTSWDALGSFYGGSVAEDPADLVEQKYQVTKDQEILVPGVFDTHGLPVCNTHDYATAERICRLLNEDEQ